MPQLRLGVDYELEQQELISLAGDGRFSKELLDSISDLFCSLYITLDIACFIRRFNQNLLQTILLSKMESV